MAWPFRYRPAARPLRPVLAGLLAIGLFALAARAYNFATLWLVETRSGLAYLPFMALSFAVLPLMIALFAWAAKKSGPRRKDRVIWASGGFLVLLYLAALRFQVEPLIDLFPHMPGSNPQFSLWRILAFLGTAVVFLAIASFVTEPRSEYYPRRRGPYATGDPGDPGGDWDWF